MKFITQVLSLVVGIHLIILASAVHSRADDEDPGNLAGEPQQQGYYRTRPNGVQEDNYSAYGNRNPYTQQMGHDRERPTYNAINSGYPAPRENEATRIFSHHRR